MKTKEQELYELTEAQERSIAKGRQDILDGKYKPHDEVMKEARAMIIRHSCVFIELQMCLNYL